MEQKFDKEHVCEVISGEVLQRAGEEEKGIEWGDGRECRLRDSYYTYSSE